VTRRVLCDENIPHGLRKAISGFDVATAQYIGFGGLKNGELLNAAEAAGFNVLVTGDKTLEYEQNMAGRNIAVVALSAPHWSIIKNHTDRIALAIEGAAPGSIIRIDVGAFARQRRTLGPPPG
jgi:hypothetical protein